MRVSPDCFFACNCRALVKSIAGSSAAEQVGVINPARLVQQSGVLAGGRGREDAQRDQEGDDSDGVVAFHGMDSGCGCRWPGLTGC